METHATKQMPTPILSDDPAQLPERPPLPREGLVRALVLVGAALLLIPNAGSFGLWDCWETHYGEVARYMFETGDLLSPWWGYKEQIGDEPATGEWFFSKPVLIMYGEILFMKLIGLSEWAIRLPWAILGTLGVFFTYVFVARLFGRTAGLLAAGVLLTSPLWFFLSRQAITDMPFVGTMTIGLLFFLDAYFGPKHTLSNRAFFGWLLATMTLFLLITVPQFVMLALDLEPESGYENVSGALRTWLIFQKTGLYHALAYSLATVVLLGAIAASMAREYRQGSLLSDASKDKWARRFALWNAYMFLGLATLGKGLLGFMLPGAILALYLLLTSEWRALRRIEIIRGSTFMCLVMLPWYLGMLAKHGNAFYARFFVHDHFNRLGAGVHQIDTGTFEHFIKWLSVGMWPWIGFVPLVILGIIRLRIRDGEPTDKAKLFLYIWSFFAYVVFTMSATKFHHYIFPALPPLAILIGLHLKDFLAEKGLLGRLLPLLASGIVVAVGLWIHTDPQAFRNMFTYQYDRQFPEHLPIDPDAPVASGATKTWRESTFYDFTNPFIKRLLTLPALEYETFTLAVMIVSAVAAALMFFLGLLRRLALSAFWIASAGLLFWCLNYYMPMISPSWSQKYLFEDYYKRCTPAQNPSWIEDAYTPIVSRLGLGFIADYFGSRGKRVCDEDVVAWLITWRGETFYTASEIKPLMKASQLGPYLETMNRGRPFFALTQAGRYSSLKTYLDRETSNLRNKGVPEFQNIRSWEVTLLNAESQYFNMVKATPIMKEEETRPEPAEEKPELPEQRVDSPPSM